MRIACFLYPGFTSIDLIAPITVWQFIPNVKFEFIAAEKGLVTTDTGLMLNASHSYVDSASAPDVIFVPGGAKPTIDALSDTALLESIGRLGQNASWVTSVCTGSLLLAAAGLLRGYRSACHWYPREWLEKFGAIPANERVVIDRNRATGGGATSGMDFALHMAGKWGGETAGRLIELLIEYAPEPPYRTGRPELADAQTLSTAREILAGEFSEAVVDQAARRSASAHVGTPAVSA